VRKYGLDFPDGWSEAMVELSCYAQAIKPEDGGLGQQAHLRNAMIALWPTVYGGEVEPGVPRWRDDLEMLTWAWCNYRVISVIGHASAAKTHTFGHIAAASYIADAANSIITLTSTHLPGLRKRLWSDTVSAIRTAQITDNLVGGIAFDVRNHDMTIRPAGTKEDKYVIEGIATDRGQDAVEKIQGTHSRHRRYVIIDEAQGTPSAIFDAAANLMTDPDFRMAQLANPTRRYSEFGTWCEPQTGWGHIDPDLDQFWETKRGGVCVRLDGLKSANIKAGKTVFPFLIRQDYLDSVSKAFGEGSPRWWTYVRGWFAPEGLFGVIYPSSVLNRAEKKLEYQFQPKRIASLDPAFEGGDQCVLAIGEYGEANGSQHAMNLVSTISIKVAVTEKSDPLDYLIAAEVKRLCIKHEVLPENFILDVTGAGRGVAAILEKDWSPEINKCNFGGGATDRRLKKSDTENCSELFDRFVSELWWAGRAWMEEGLVGGVDSESKTLRDQLIARQYETVKDKKIRIETKREMKERLGYSPDEADAFVMLIELLRRKGGVAGVALGAVAGSRDNRLQKRAVKYSNLLNPEKEFSNADAS
jgi:hypothetical protein